MTRAIDDMGHVRVLMCKTALLTLRLPVAPHLLGSTLLVTIIITIIIIMATTSASSPSIEEEESKVADDGDLLTALDADIQKSAPRVMKHMNEDHADSLKAYVLAFGTPTEICQRCESAILTGLDIDGFILDIIVRNDRNDNDDEKQQQVTVRVPYDRPIQSAKDLHQVAVRMHILAYKKLGVWYKIRTGYYNRAFRMMGAELNKILGKAKASETIRTVATKATVLLVGSVAAVLLIHGYSRRRQQQQCLKG